MFVVRKRLNTKMVKFLWLNPLEIVAELSQLFVRDHLRLANRSFLIQLTKLNEKSNHTVRLKKSP